MKEIQGKIKFIVAEVDNRFPHYKLSGTNYLCFGYNGKWPVIFDNPLPLGSEIVGRFSEITEEQADEFVERYCLLKGNVIDEDLIVEEDTFFGYKNYINNMTLQLHEFKTAKESLISLLKANDVWIKEWCNYKDFDKKSEKDKLDAFDQIQFQNDCLDDLLLIKLK